MPVAVGGETPILLAGEELSVLHLGRGDGNGQRLARLAERDCFGQRTRLDDHADCWGSLDQGRDFEIGTAFGGPKLSFDPPKWIAQLKLDEHSSQLRAVRLGVKGGHFKRVNVEWDIALNCRELLAKPSVTGKVRQVLLALGARDLINTAENRLERAKFLEQRCRCLVTDPRHARNVVGRIAFEAIEVRDQLRGDPVALDHALVVVELRLGDAARGSHDSHPTLGVNQLKRVAVAGDDHNWHRLRCGARKLGQRRDHVVCFEAVDVNVVPAERLDDRREVRPLFAQKIGLRWAVRLVARVKFLATRRAAIPTDDRWIVAVFGVELHEHRGEAEDCIARLTLGGRDRVREREERAVGEAVAVDQIERLGHER